MTDSIKVKESNVVTMSDGTQCNFGSRANLLATMDIESKTLTFKVATGAVVSWPVEGLEAFSNFQVKVYLYGLLEKIKSSMAGVKVDGLEKAINDHIADIKEGNFNIRSAGSSVSAIGLTMVMKAYALAKGQQQEEFAHFVNLEDPAVIEEVAALWAEKTPSEKRSDRANPFVQYQLAVLEQEANPDAGSEL